MTRPIIDASHDPSRRSWVVSAAGHADFPIQNLPFGVYSLAGQPSKIGVAIGDEILDLAACGRAQLLPASALTGVFENSLNSLFDTAPAVRRELRTRLSTLLSDVAHRNEIEPLLTPAGHCQLHLPARIGDYTDFYAGIHHATHVGRLFRPDAPLLPNYKYVPIGYHGRASSVRESGIPLTRPKAQRKNAAEQAPVYAPTERLDYELELGIWVASGNSLGTPLSIQDAADHIAGYCLLNDWSARDVQTWEYQPLGPFLAKSFHTTISPWVITPEALAPFQIPQPRRPEGDPEPLAYLNDKEDQARGALALDLEVYLRTAEMRVKGLAPHRISRTSAENLYWTAAQLLTHHASNGCNLNPGDLLGTGTISSPEPGGFGSLLEITEGGAKPFTLPNGEIRRFLEDGDEIEFRARARSDRFVPIGFGPCVATVGPARD